MKHDGCGDLFFFFLTLKNCSCKNNVKRLIKSMNYYYCFYHFFIFISIIINYYYCEYTKKRIYVAGQTFN